MEELLEAFNEHIHEHTLRCARVGTTGLKPMPLDEVK